MKLVKRNGLYLWSCTVKALCINIILVSGFSQSTKNEEEKYILNEIFNNIPHLIKTIFMSIVFKIFLLYKDKLIIRKREVITHTTDYMIPVGCYLKKYI